MVDKPLPDMADPILDRLTTPERLALNLWYSHGRRRSTKWWWLGCVPSVVLVPWLLESWEHGNVQTLVLCVMLIACWVLQVFEREGFTRIAERYARELRRSRGGD